MSKTAVFLSSIKMALATICSRILGLVREQVMAHSFGASGLTDAFLVAYRIPNMLRDLFAEGAFSSAFVPNFAEANNLSHEQGRKLLWSLFIILILITSFISINIFIFSEELIRAFAPSFVPDPEKFEIAVNLTKIMSPFLVFVSVAALFMGALNSLKVFFIPALSPAFFNISMIASMLLLPSYFISEGMNPIYSLGVGVFIGGLLQGIVQFPLILKRGFGPQKVEKVISPRSAKVMKMLGPGLVGFAATQLNLIVNTILATGAAVGAVSWLSYAFRLFQLPGGILSVSIGNSNLVHFSNSWKSGEFEKAKSFLSSSYFLSFITILPAMVALIFLSEEIVNVIFERGRFTHDSTIMTARALSLYALGLPFYGIYKILVPTFYTLDAQKVPVYSSITSVLFNIIFCVSLVPIYGFEVLALGTTLSMFLNSTILIVVLKQKLSLEFSYFINLRMTKIMLATVLTSILIYFVKNQFVFNQFAFLERCVILFGFLIVVALSYVFFLTLLGERVAMRSILSKLKSKLSRKS